MRNLSNAEADLKKSIGYKKACIVLAPVMKAYLYNSFFVLL